MWEISIEGKETIEQKWGSERECRGYKKEKEEELKEMKMA